MLKIVYEKRIIYFLIRCGEVGDVKIHEFEAN